MNIDSSTISWNKAGDDWVSVAQTNDFRMYFIMPYTLQKIGDVTNLKILDIGCGEGGYARDYFKMFIKHDLQLIDFNEPIPTEEQISKSNRIDWLTKIPMFLFIELKK